MMEKCAVFMCGKSLCITGLASLLQHDADFEVVILSGLSETLPFLGEKRLAAIVFDMQELSQARVNDLVMECLGGVLIGLNPEKSEAVVFSCHRYQVSTISVLKKIITSALGPDTYREAK